MQYECPYCQNLFQINESLYGRKVRCNKCDQRFVIDPPKQEPEPMDSTRVEAPRTTKKEPDFFPLPVANFGALKFVRFLLLIEATIAGSIGTLFGIANIAMSSGGIGSVIGFYTILASVTGAIMILAMCELITLALKIEENTREAANAARNH